LIVRIDIDKEKSGGKEIETDLKNLMERQSVPRSKTVVDSDGLGSYLESYLNGIKEFHGGAKANDEKEFANLKSECGYKLAEVVNKRQIKVICTQAQKQRIIEEMAVLKSKDVDADESKKRIISKDEMKTLLGRSPDYLDMLLMGMLFEVIRPPRRGSWAQSE
jgi:phage terminase large subunit